MTLSLFGTFFVQFECPHMNQVWQGFQHFLRMWYTHMLSKCSLNWPNWPISFKVWRPWLCTLIEVRPNTSRKWMKFSWTKHLNWFFNSSFSLSVDNAVKVLKLEAFSFGKRLEYLLQTSMLFIPGRNEFPSRRLKKCRKIMKQGK